MKTNRPAKQTHSRTQLGSRLCFLLLLLFLLMPFRSVGQVRDELQESNTTVDFTPAELRPMPSPAVIAKARGAYFRGDIVRIVGGSAEDMKRLLGVNVATVNSGKASTSSDEVIAVRKSHYGMREYHARIKGPDGSRAASWRRGFDVWRKSRAATAATVEDPSPPSDAWTLIQQGVYSDVPSGNTANYTISIYRLNTIQTDYDYYMVIQDSNANPDYIECYAAVIGPCGWWTDHRTFSMSAGPGSVLTDHGPTGTITSESTGFSIGASLNSAGPGISAGFSESWNQPSVTTTDHSDNTTAAWREDFTGRYLTNPPPDTARGSFLSHQGAIFRVPFGQSFTLAVSNSARFVFHDELDLDINGSPDDHNLQVNIPVYPPILSMSPKSLTIGPGQARVALVTATIPSSNQGLSWQLTADPAQGLSISQTTGADSASLLLTVEPGQPLGTTWNLNLQTDPPYGAPAVALNPIRVTVKAGSSPPSALEGILLAGGMTDGTPSSSAEVYDTVNNTIVPVGPLTTARYEHTATVLTNGKVLIAGGGGGSSGVLVGTATAEIYDPNTESFAPVQGATQCPGVAGCMMQPRYGHTATLLPDGRVLISGGLSDDDDATNTAEIYNPVTQTFTATGRMATARAFHAAAWIPSQRKVLISGGYTTPVPNDPIQSALASSEWFDPATGQFSPGPNLPTPQAGPASVSTGPCTFCLIGGSNGPLLNAFPMFSADTAAWTSASPLNISRFLSGVTPVGNSELLVTGGLTEDSQKKQHVSATAEVNSITSNRWGGWKFTSSTANCPGEAGCMVAARANHTASVLLDGRVLLAGGRDDAGNSLTTTEIFDPASRTFSAGPVMNSSRFGHTATAFHATNLTTTTTLNSSQNPSIYGQPVTFMATVTSPSGATPIGSVTFNDGSTPLGVVQLTGGTASFKAPSLSGGDHSIQAVYNGNDMFASSRSATISQIISTLTPSISVVSSANPSARGDSVTFTAKVSSSDGTPQGTVDFLDGTTVLRTVPLQQEEAIYSTNTLTGGTHSITAKYSGDSNYQGATSQALNQTVLIDTQTALTSSVNPSAVGQAIVFTAIVSAATGITPTGFIDFVVSEGLENRRVRVSMQAGSARYAFDQLTEGKHSVTATYTPDTNSDFADSTSPTLIQSVLNKTTMLLTSSANPANPGQAVTFRASVMATAGTPTGTMDFLDGTSVIASRIPMTNGSATYSTSALKAGSHSITAVYRPDANSDFGTSTSNPLVQVILSMTSTALTSSINPSSHGQPVTFTATVTGTGGTLTGTVTFTDGGTTLGQAPLNNGGAVFSTATLARGAHAIVASYSGDGTFAPSKSSTVTQTVNLTTPSVTLSSSQNPSNQGQAVTFTATVTGPAGTSPTGTVVFLDGLLILGSAVISNATASYSTSGLAVGTHSVTAAYHGDDNFTPATSQPVRQVVQVAPCLPTTVSPSASPSPSVVGQTVSFTAVVTWSGGGTPVGNVTISETMDNGQVRIWGTASLDSGGTAVVQVEGLPLGTHRMYATYGGDAPTNHCGATSASLDQTVNAPSTQ